MEFSFDWNFVSAGAPYVTISSFGISFNSVCISLLNNPECVIMGFDKNNVCLGIKAYTNEPNVKKYEFSKKMKNNWIRIGAKDFVKHLGEITGNDYSAAIKYVAQFDDENKVLFVTINKD